MGMFFNKNKNKNSKKVQEEKIIDNAYVLKNFKLKFSSSIVVKKREYLKFNTAFSIDCDKDYCFDIKWEENSYIHKDKLTSKYGTFVLSYNIFPDEIKNINLSIFIYDYDGDHNEINLGDSENWRKNIEGQFYFSDEVRTLIFKVIDKINFTKDLNFARRFVTNPEEFERMLKHINYQEAKIKQNNNQVTVTSQTIANKNLLEAKKNELLSANTSRNSVTSNNYENDPLGEYIANQAKQKKKQR